ncbi:MAG: hypothetical protein DMF84_00010 [Acidobacteria bacterium]|nr:MAG: hypothetical protein DMF84_00010 [Acidobacteriota bacterium]
MSTATATNITGVLVERLFGLYDYALGTYGTDGKFEPNLVVLYGDNGSGKTTLLRLIYHVLSKEQKRGHRTALGAIPLRRFQVRLEDGTEVGMVRDQDPIKGTYRFFVARPGVAEQACVAIVAQDGTANPAADPDSQERWAATMDALGSLNVALYYLPDNRRPESDAPSDETEIDVEQQYSVVLRTDAFGQVISRRGIAPPKQGPLDAAISDLQDLIRDDALGAASIGEANINSIYAEIAKRVLETKGEPLAASQAQGRDLPKALETLMEQSRPFSRVGLLPQLDLRELVDHSTRAKATTRRILATVLQPYVESVSARLEALGPIQRLLETFVGTLNSFYAQKRVTFDLREGLRIIQPDGTRLSPRALSSGEQQLLLLFCNTVLARAQATIFIIDEPELSLNVKWQRRLIDALLQLVVGTPVQFMLATHSIELLAKYKEGVVRLNPAPITERPV